MIPSKPPEQGSAYLDFSQFGKLKRDSRAGEESALQATAKQLEGVFLNMMLKSMRDANAAFSEGNYLTSKDTEYFQDMYDHQLALNLSSGKGIGMAEMIVKQMKRTQGDKNIHPDNQAGYDIATYHDRVIPALLRRELSSETLAKIEQEMQQEPVEAAVFAPVPATLPVVPAAADNQPPVIWDSPEAFVKAIYPHAERAAKQLNVDPVAIVAQAALESGWGQHAMRDEQGNNSFNLFGIKADDRWQGDVIKKKTLEYRNGIAAPETAAFRSYATLENAFDDYVSFLKNNSRYQQVFQLNSEPKQWGFALQQAGYATDPKYGNKIANIMESDVLRSHVESGNGSL